MSRKEKKPQTGLEFIAKQYSMIDNVDALINLIQNLTESQKAEVLSAILSSPSDVLIGVVKKVVEKSSTEGLVAELSKPYHAGNPHTTFNPTGITQQPTVAGVEEAKADTSATCS